MKVYRTALLVILVSLTGGQVLAQAELEPWGNLNGIRVQGQLFPFSTCLRVVYHDGTLIISTAKKKQRPAFIRNGAVQTVNTRIDSLYFREDVEDLGEGIAQVRVTCIAEADEHLEGVYLSLEVPAAGHGDTIRYTDPKGIHTLYSGTPSQVNIPIHLEDMSLGDTARTTITFQVSGPIDRTPVHFLLRTDQPGRPFEGMGGNFRIQNLRVDPGVIDYNLKNLRVAWARVEMPWRFWEPTLRDRPLDSPAVLNPAVVRAMEMAQRLGKQGIPLILSAWFPPDWAIRGPVKFRPGADGVWGNPLDSARLEDVYRSIADYIVYLRDHYGTRIKLFSFNESDLGINVRMTGLEHDAFIKGMGAYLKSRGLDTKMLLGDNSDATTYRFIQPAMDDPEALPFIGAVCFHSWRGCDSATLEHWSSAAARLHLPLIVAEGSIDAAAWNYPAIFGEQSYALREIGLYTRLLALAQPVSILQWQLTSDYSLLAGGGVFGDNGPLRPTQRFWNFKQMASTPPGLQAMPLACNRQGISCAALGNAKGIVVLHIVNDGAAREATVEGLSAATKTLRIYTTTNTKAIEEGPPVKVSGGRAQFSLDARSFTTVEAK
jgi:hypothetical protein